MSIADADVVGGRVQVADARSGETHVAEGIDGRLRLEALEGPVLLPGRRHGGRRRLRPASVASGKLNEAGATTLSLSVASADRSFTLDAEGALQTGADAQVHRRSQLSPATASRAAEGETVDIGRGDLVLEGKVEAAADRVLLSNYTLLPDENRARDAGSPARLN